MATAFVTSRRVEFSDTDAAGIMHFVAFFRMMEQAEHELLRSVGLSVVMHEPSGKIELAAGRREVRISVRRPGSRTCCRSKCRSCGSARRA